LQKFHTTYCEETIDDDMNQEVSFITSVTAVKATCTCKLVRLLPDRRTVRLIMELVGNRTFALTTANGKLSRLRRLKNGVQVQQGFVLVPILFILCISDLPTTVSRTYACANDLAIMHAYGDWQTVERVLSKDLVTLGEYLWTCRLKLSITKAVLAAFHLSNKEA